MTNGPKDDLIVSAICTCLVCDVRTHKRFNETIRLAEFEKYKVNLVCQTCNSPFGSVIPETAFEVEHRDKTEDQSRQIEKKPAYVQKYYNSGHLAEAVIVNGLSFFYR